MDKASFKNLRDRRRAAGLCTRCGKPSGGAFYCETHAAENSRNASRASSERYALLRAHGLCTCCKSYAEGGRSLCEKCAKEKRRAEKRYKLRRKAGLCHVCDTPAISGQTLCEKHARLRRAYARRRYVGKFSPNTPKVINNESREGEHETNLKDA